MPVYDPGTGTGRMLALDLDLGRIRDSADPVTEIEHQAAALGQLLERLGSQVLADTVPSGGRHVYVLFAAALPWLELRDVARALALRFPVIDPAPMSSLGGQIAPPGSRHKRGGWRVLTMSPEAASAVVEQLNGPEVWAALLAELAAELQQVETGTASAESSPAGAELDDTGEDLQRNRNARLALSVQVSRALRELGYCSLGAWVLLSGGN